MPAFRYVRVKDKRTGHQYDVLEQSFDPEKHTKVARFPVVSRPRPPKPYRRKGDTAAD